jgi:hypothetical protein
MLIRIGTAQNDITKLYVARRRKRHEPAAANISITAVAGSGTAKAQREGNS